MKIAQIFASLFVLSWPINGFAQSDPNSHGKKSLTESIEDAKQALVRTQQASALSMPIFLFVKEKSSGYGMYSPRNSNIFKSGETLRFYMEPEGYAIKRIGDMFSFGFPADLTLKSASGESIIHKDVFLDQDFISHHANKEIMFNGYLDITGEVPGAMRWNCCSTIKCHLKLPRPNYLLQLCNKVLPDQISSW